MHALSLVLHGLGTAVEAGEQVLYIEVSYSSFAHPLSHVLLAVVVSRVD